MPTRIDGEGATVKNRTIGLRGRIVRVLLTLSISLAGVGFATAITNIARADNFPGTCSSSSPSHKVFGDSADASVDKVYQQNGFCIVDTDAAGNTYALLFGSAGKFCTWKNGNQKWCTGAGAELLLYNDGCIRVVTYNGVTVWGNSLHITKSGGGFVFNLAIGPTSALDSHKYVPAGNAEVDGTGYDGVYRMLMWFGPDAVGE